MNCCHPDPATSETHASTVTGVSECEWCSSPVSQSGRGPRARYCSSTCRARASDSRRTEQALLLLQPTPDPGLGAGERLLEDVRQYLSRDPGTSLLFCELEDALRTRARIRAQVAAAGSVQPLPSGRQVAHPLLGEVARLDKRVVDLLHELVLTPRSRARAGNVPGVGLNLIAQLNAELDRGVGIERSR